VSICVHLWLTDFPSLEEIRQSTVLSYVPKKTAGLVIVDGALRILIPKEQMDQFMTTLRTNYQAAATGQGPRSPSGLLCPIGWT
jgi:hypothetical protein